MNFKIPPEKYCEQSPEVSQLEIHNQSPEVSQLVRSSWGCEDWLTESVPEFLWNLSMTTDSIYNINLGELYCTSQVWN